MSPLNAPSNDVHKNLMEPLQGIGKRLLPGATLIRAAVRTGDTPGKERAQVFKHPPHILVTTPESLYVLLGSASGKKLLAAQHAVGRRARGARSARRAPADAPRIAPLISSTRSFRTPPFGSGARVLSKSRTTRFRSAPALRAPSACSLGWLTFPWHVRFALARDSRLATKVIAILVESEPGPRVS